MQTCLTDFKHLFFFSLLFCQVIFNAIIINFFFLTVKLKFPAWISLRNLLVLLNPVLTCVSAATQALLFRQHVFSLSYSSRAKKKSFSTTLFFVVKALLSFKLIRLLWLFYFLRLFVEQNGHRGQRKGALLSRRKITSFIVHRALIRVVIIICVLCGTVFWKSASLFKLERRERKGEDKQCSNSFSSSTFSFGCLMAVR